MGLRLDWLGSESLSWRDLLVIIRQAPPGSALDRHARPEQWSNHIELLAQLVDTTRWLQWSKTEDGSKNQNHPRPTPRPDDPARPESKGIPMHEAAKALGWATTESG